jgi:hypothetical protein
MRSDRSYPLELARKYKTLLALRAESSEAPTAELRALAEEFPGALRELDTLPKSQLEERLEQCSRAAADGSLAPWMAWMYAYHTTMRAALSVKSRLAGKREPDAAEIVELTTWLATLTGHSYDAEFIRSVAAPPEGRLNRVVLRLVAKQFQLSPETLVTTLFPGRRVRIF